MKPANDHMQRLLDTLGRAIARAMASSADVSAALEQLRGEGYSLSLSVDCHHDDSASSTLALSTSAAAQRDAAGPARERTSPPPASEPRPTFRLNGHDVALLKSLGIDATRSAKRRRSR